MSNARTALNQARCRRRRELKRVRRTECGGVDLWLPIASVDVASVPTERRAELRMLMTNMRHVPEPIVCSLHSPVIPKQRMVYPKVPVPGDLIAVTGGPPRHPNDREHPCVERGHELQVLAGKRPHLDRL